MTTPKFIPLLTSFSVVEASRLEGYDNPYTDLSTVYAVVEASRLEGYDNSLVGGYGLCQLSCRSLSFGGV